jgi:hypothetical protein
MYERKSGDGALFQNRKQNDKQPDVRGNLLLDGKEYEIAGWQKSTRNGDPWWALKVQPARPKQQSQGSQPARGTVQNGAPGDDVPW